MVNYPGHANRECVPRPPPTPPPALTFSVYILSLLALCVYKLPKSRGKKALSPKAGTISPQRGITAPVSSRPSPTGERSKDQSGHRDREGQRSYTASAPTGHHDEGHPPPCYPVLEGGSEDETLFRAEDEDEGLQGGVNSLDEAVADFDIALRDHRNKRRGLLNCLTTTNAQPREVVEDTAASTWLDGEASWATVSVGGVDDDSLRGPLAFDNGEEDGVSNGIDGRNDALTNNASKLDAYSGKNDQSQSSQQGCSADGSDTLPERSCGGETVVPPGAATEDAPLGERQKSAGDTEPGYLLEENVSTPSDVAAERAEGQGNERSTAEIWTHERGSDPGLSLTESPLLSPLHEPRQTDSDARECPPSPLPSPTAGDTSPASLDKPSDILQDNRGVASRASTSFEKTVAVSGPSNETTPPMKDSAPPNTAAGMAPSGEVLSGISGAGSMFEVKAVQGAIDASLAQTMIAPATVAAMKSPDVISTPEQRMAGDWMEGTAAPDGRPPAPHTVAEAEAQLAGKVERLHFSRLTAEREKREAIEEGRARKFGQEHADRHATFAEEDQRLLEQEEKRWAELRGEADLGRLQRGAEFEETDDSIVDSGAVNKPVTTTATAATAATAATVAVAEVASVQAKVGVPMPVRGMRPQHYREAEDLPDGVRQAAAPRPAENVLDELAGLEARAKAAGGGMSIEKFEKVEQRQRGRQLERLEILHAQTAEEKEEIVLEMTVRLQMFARCSIARTRVGRLRETRSFSKEKVRGLQLVACRWWAVPHGRTT